MLELTRVYHFSAGHRLADPALSDEANEVLYGACYRPHGHNYYLEVTVAGQPDPVTGMAVRQYLNHFLQSSSLYSPALKRQAMAAAVMAGRSMRER